MSVESVVLARPLGWFDRAASRLGDSVDHRTGGLAWLGAALAIGVLAAVSLLVQGLSPVMVQDDARQFLTWMSRWTNPAFEHDLLGIYWASVSPWLYRWIFTGFHLLGIPPVLGAKLVAAALLATTGFFAFRFVLGFSRDPVAAFLAASVLIILIGQEDIVVTGTPRAFWPALLFAVLDGLQRRSMVQTPIAQLLLSGVYPHAALVSATVIGLTLLKVAPLRLDFSRRRLMIVGFAALATIVGVLPFVLQTQSFGPIVTIGDIPSMPTFHAGGRGAILGPDGSMNFACGKRLGYVSWSDCSGFTDVRFWLQALPLAAGPIMLLAQMRRRGVGTPLPFFAWVASLFWFAAAALLLFRLHLPSRFGASLITPVSVVSFIPVLPALIRGFRERTKLPRRWADRLLLVSTATLVIALAVGAAMVHPYYWKPTKPKLMAALATVPPEAVIAGFEADLDFVPVLLARRVLFSREHTIAYQMGYYRAIEGRMSDMAEVETTDDPDVLADRLKRNAVDIYLVDAERVRTLTAPQGFGGFLENDGPPRSIGPPLLPRLAPLCEKGVFDGTMVLDAYCLVERARTG